MGLFSGLHNAIKWIDPISSKFDVAGAVLDPAQPGAAPRAPVQAPYTPEPTRGNSYNPYTAAGLRKDPGTFLVKQPTSGGPPSNPSAPQTNPIPYQGGGAPGGYVPNFWAGGGQPPMSGAPAPVTGQAPLQGGPGPQMRPGTGMPPQAMPGTGGIPQQQLQTGVAPSAPMTQIPQDPALQQQMMMARMLRGGRQSR